MRLLRMIYWLCCITMMLVLLGTYLSAEKVEKTKFRAGGAKVVSVNSDRGSDRESKSLVERVWDWAYVKSGANAGQGGTTLKDLHARQAAQSSPMNGADYDSTLRSVEEALNAAESAGVAVGPTVFDGDLARRRAERDPIQRLNRN